MDKIVLIVIGVVIAYIVFVSLKSTFNLIFKIAVIILALSFLGYNFLDLGITEHFSDAITDVGKIEVNETITNETSVYPVNTTVSNVTAGNSSEVNITAV
ncbi:MAG: hypothetical protein V1914_03335 [archaeon]